MSLDVSQRVCLGGRDEDSTSSSTCSSSGVEGAIASGWPTRDVPSTSASLTKEAGAFIAGELRAH
jgi:hypothetical protein